MNGAEALARILQQEGVEYLFAYPNHPLIDAAARLGIRPIIARGEKTLINIADGYTRASNGRRPAVIVVQGGPGIENAFGGLAQAFADSVPLLVIPGGSEQRRLSEPPQFDPLPVYRHISKWVGRVNFPERIPELARRAFSQLRNGRRAPVLLELPYDVAGAQLDEGALAYAPARGYRSAGDPEDVAAAADALLEARRPVLHVGHGVLWAEASDELRELAELVQAPVMTTMAGKSAFPENHPLSIGAGGHTLSDTAAHFLVRADLVFGIGCSFARGNFSTAIPGRKRLVQITHDADGIDRDYPVERAVVGDAKLVLRQLIDRIGPRQRGQDTTAEVRGLRQAERQKWLPRLTADSRPISPFRAIWDLMNGLDRTRAIVTHDSGNPRDQMLTTYEALVPRGYIGWGKSTQLGTGLGIALGAKLARPDYTVVNVMGDLAFGTVGMEVETAVRERLPIVTFLLNNGRMGGYDHHMPTASQRFGSNLLSGDYARVAAALGAHSERVEEPAEVSRAIERALEAARGGRAAVIEVLTAQDTDYPVSGQA
ncbi:MAG: thiamine pyrophosphate-requiring protein, partial [Chloroflexota bacterium]|nr:thiamine pyrophosphate-requiring protein [Chloroflexota bacterium]